MNQAEEEALVASCWKQSYGHGSCGGIIDVFDEQSIRLAIRAAVAQERERAARVCERIADSKEGSAEGYERNCADAIRRNDALGN